MKMPDDLAEKLKDPLFLAQLIDRSIELERQLAALREATRWHLCSEGQPTKPDNYLVQIRDQFGEARWVFRYNHEHWWEWNGERWVPAKDDSVIAWMPLPAPYQPPDEGGEK